MVESHAREGYRRKHRSLVDDVADHVGLRRDVVEDVLNGFYDIIAERILNERKLVLTDILSIRAVVARNGIRPEPHLQYRAKVAQGLRKLLQKMEDDPAFSVDRESWRQAAAQVKSGARTKSTSMDLNDFLRDDDED